MLNHPARSLIGHSYHKGALQVPLCRRKGRVRPCVENRTQKVQVDVRHERDVEGAHRE